MTPTPYETANPGLQDLVEMTEKDLAQRLGVPVSEIVVLEAIAVVWSDASLGCPREGMQYAQVLTPGYLIRLQSGEQEFEYHASQALYFMYCENPVPPVSGTPADV